MTQLTPADSQLMDWGIKQFGPVTVVLAIFIIGLMRLWWVIGWQYQAQVKLTVEAKERGDRLESMVFELLAVGKTAVSMVKRAD